MNYVKMEFYKRDMKSEYDYNKKRVNTLKLLLKEHELKRFENEVTVEPQYQGVNNVSQPATLTSKLIILEETMDAKNVPDDTWNKFAVEVKNIEKLQSTDFAFDDVVDFW